MRGLPIEAVQTRRSATGPIALDLDIERIYDAHVQEVARWVRRLGGPDIEVEDLTQDVFMIALRQLHRFEPKAQVRTWLFGIARNVVSHYRRGTSRRKGTFGSLANGVEAPSAGDSEPLDNIDRRQREARLYRLLDQLPEKYRVPVILFEIEELSGEQIAQLLQVKVATCWTLVHRGRRKLAKRLIALERAESQPFLRGTR